MANEVKLDGKYYAVRGQIRSQAFNPWAEPLRIVGNLQRRDRTNANQWIQESYRSGLGYYRAVGETPANVDTGHPSYRGFFDSTLETRWEGQVSLPGNPQAISHTNDGTGGEPDHNYVKMFTAPMTSSELPGVYAYSKNTAESIASFTSGASNFAEAKDLTSGYTNFRPTAVVQHDGDWIIFGGVEGASAAKVVKIQANGTFADLSPTTVPGTRAGPTVVGHPTDVVSFQGVDLYAAVWERANGVIQIEKSADGGDVWAAQAGLEVATKYGSTSTMTRFWAKLIEYFDADGDPALYLCTNDTLYLVDITGADLLPVIKFGTSVMPATDVKPVVWNGDLYIPRGKSLVKFNFSGAWEEVSAFELGTVPADYQTTNSNRGFTALTASDRWLFCGYSSQTAAFIWAYDGVGFHFIAKIRPDATAVSLLHDLILFDTGTDLAIDLIALIEDRGSGASDADFFRIRKILEDPLNPSAYAGGQFATSGTLVTPWFDGGMSEVDSIILASGGGFKGLASGKTVKAEMALEYSDAYQTASATIATFTADTDKITRYGASTTRGPGVSARAWRHRYTLATDANTATPALFYPVTYYKKKPPRIHEIAFLVDLEESVRLNQYEWTSADDVLEALNDAAESTVLIPLEFPGKGAVTSLSETTTLYVEVEGIPAQHSGGMNPSAWLPEVESGTALVICRQVFED